METIAFLMQSQRAVLVFVAKRMSSTYVLSHKRIKAIVMLAGFK